MLGLIPKQSSFADIHGALTHALGPKEAARHDGLFKALQNARQRALAPTAEDSSFGDRAALRAYRSQLTSLESRLPKASIDATKLVFNWTDTLKPKAVVSHSSIGYERASLLFNEAALMSRMAAKAVSQRNSEGRNEGQKIFRDAAAALLYIKDVLMPQCVASALRAGSTSRSDLVACNRSPTHF